MKGDITSDDILGKKAVDSDGAILGVITKLHINNNEKKIIGITVDQGFMKPDLFIGLQYVKHFGIDAVLLNEFPLEKLKGLPIFTESGKKIGNVGGFTEDNHHLKEIIIKKMLHKPFSIATSDILQIGTSIILKDDFKEITQTTDPQS